MACCAYYEVVTKSNFSLQVSQSRDLSKTSLFQVINTRLVLIGDAERSVNNTFSWIPEAVKNILVFLDYIENGSYIFL